MKSKTFLLVFLFLLVVSSCEKFLDPLPKDDHSFEDMWKYQDFVQGLIGQCYDNMSRNYDDNEGAYLDGATDNAVLTNTTEVLQRLATGSIPTSMDPFERYWDRDYRSINLVNTFLKDNRGFRTRFLIVPHLDSLVRNRLQGEAYALRAWFQWDLLQKFGGRGTNGELLGYPIVLEPLEVSVDVNLARDTYDNCVKQIIKDCDSAFKYLPIAHRDFLVPDATDRTYAGGRYWGRFDGITTRAIKAMVYLTWASPRFNPNNDMSRWDSAAANAKKVIDFKLTVDGTQAAGFRIGNGVNWVNPNFPGIVFSSRHRSSNDDMERMFYPGGFQGNGEIGPTQELVDAFGMDNGYPIDHEINADYYDKNNPYANRDPRFYSTIFYNTAVAKRNNTGAVMYTFENWENGGKDAAEISPNNSRTNYHVKKFVYMGLNWSDPTVDRQPHSKFYIRWAHMCLIFAEAANQVVGPTTSLYGLTAKEALGYLRSRNTYDGAAGITADNYLDEVAAAGKDEFDKLVKNERRIETCFEGMRFYDLRRWTTDLTELNKAVHGVTVIKNEDGTYTYDLNNEIENRRFQSAYLPIPYNEMLKMSNLIQNEGWTGWN